MKLRRNAFYYFALSVFAICVLFSMACALQRLGDGQEYPYLLKGAWLLFVLVLGGVTLGLGVLWARLELSRRLGAHKRLCDIAEALAAVLLALAGLMLRLMVIRKIPMAPASDYKTYYEIADLLHKGVLVKDGPGYCDYVAMFPHVFGYPAILSTVFNIMGTSVSAALGFNLILQIAGLLVIWRIGRLVGGRFCGLVAMAAATFMPSAILYSSFVASEPLFTLLLLLAIWLFAISLRDTPAQQAHPWLCAGELVAMAITLAVGSFVRPMAAILLVAIIICMLPGYKRLPPLPRNDVPLGFRATNTGWKRCALVLAVYLGVSSLLTLATGYAVDRQLAGGSSSFGYNLLVGLNLDSYGGWNQEDADYLYAAFDATGSAEEAQLACRDMALQRLKVDPKALLNLFVHKFEVLWGNDDYGASWNILFTDQQGNLTPSLEAFLYRAMDWSDLYYLLLLLAAGIAAFLMLRRKPDAAYTCVLLFCGTVALHLLVENQNRYHYHGMTILALLTGVAMTGTMEIVYKRVMARVLQRRMLKAKRIADAEAVRLRKAEEEERVRLRAEALHAQFDMDSAIREGHIRIIASEGAREAAAKAAQAAPSAETTDEAQTAPTAETTNNAQTAPTAEATDEAQTAQAAGETL